MKIFSTDIPHSVRAAEISSEGKSIFTHPQRQGCRKLRRFDEGGFED